MKRQRRMLRELPARRPMKKKMYVQINVTTRPTSSLSRNQKHVPLTADFHYCPRGTHLHKVPSIKQLVGRRRQDEQRTSHAIVTCSDRHKFPISRSARLMRQH
ncbi:hypothetical protein BaRGS_00001634 [Batillaria attramentaria]|uniref:Uncharacterized protein n=1 Tax=Batillaria attramentaria TaxID=370345 RepID=A0ABD0M8F4_9CAEN